MAYSKEFLQLKVPSENRILLYSILLLIISVVILLFVGKIDDVIKVSGIIRTEENVSFVKNVISGKIVEKNFKPGQKVLKGDFLYKIDPEFKEVLGPVKKKIYNLPAKEIEEVEDLVFLPSGSEVYSTHLIDVNGNEINLGEPYDYYKLNSEYS